MLADRTGKPISLSVLDAAPGLISFYSRFGFSVVGTGDAETAVMVRQPRTDRLWTRGPWAPDAFRGWFRNSVVTAEGCAGGAPLVVFHGTVCSEPIRRFAGLATVGWFAEDPALANVYAAKDADDSAVYPVWLRIERPLVLTFDMDDSPVPATAVAQDLGLSGLAACGSIAHEVVNTSEFFGVVRAAGYDGIRVRERGIWTWAPVSAYQVKSAIGCTRYDPMSSDIAA